MNERDRQIMDENVHRGATWLDQVSPDWALRLDAGKLDLNSCTNCVLGQLYGEYNYGLKVMAARGAEFTDDYTSMWVQVNDDAYYFHNAQAKWAWEHGFVADNYPSSEGYIEVEDGETEQEDWYALTQTWIGEAKRRVDRGIEL